MNWKNVNEEPRVKKFAHRFFPGICFVLSLPSKAKETKERQTRERERERESAKRRSSHHVISFSFLLLLNENVFLFFLLTIL